MAPVLYQLSMNVFRRFSVDTEKMHAFYRDVLGLEQLTTFGGVCRHPSSRPIQSATGGRPSSRI